LNIRTCTELSVEGKKQDVRTHDEQTAAAAVGENQRHLSSQADGQVASTQQSTADAVQDDAAADEDGKLFLCKYIWKTVVFLSIICQVVC